MHFTQLFTRSNLLVMGESKHPVSGTDYPRTFQEFDEWFSSENACLDYIANVRWPDIRLLAHTDELHGTLSGPATKKLCERKHLGYVHIPQKWAPLINAFNRDHLNPYINFHRPCFFPLVITDAKGKQRKTYPYQAMMTPCDKFKSLPNAERYLKPGITLKQLDDMATAISDNDAVTQLNEAKLKLYKTIVEQKHRAA